jgi:hypothetical protein
VIPVKLARAQADAPPMRKFSLAVAVVTCVSLLACDLPTPSLDTKPKTFTSAPGKFSIVSPIGLKESSQPISLPTGNRVDLHMYIGEGAQAAYFASYADYPVKLVSDADPEAILDGVVQGQVSNTKGSRLVSATPIAYGEYPGRAIEIEAKQNGKTLIMRARAFLVGNRLYQLLTIQESAARDDGKSEKFFDSFKLADARASRPASESR